MVLRSFNVQFLQGDPIMCFYWLPMYLHLTFLVAMSGEQAHVHHSFRYNTSYGSYADMQALTFSPDSRQLAVSVSNHVDFIDLQDGEIIYQFQASPFNLRYTQDGKQLYMISTDQGRLLDVRSGVVLPTQYQQVISGPGINLEERNGKLLVKSLARGSSADASEALQVGDELVAFSEGQNGEMQRITGWSLKSMTEALQGYPGTFARLTVMPRGRYGAKYEKTLTLRRTSAVNSNRNGGGPASSRRALPKALGWCMVNGSHWHEFRDAATGQPVVHLETIDVENVGMCSMSPDQTKFAVVATRKDRNGNAVEIYDIASQKRLAFVPLAKSSYYDITFAADNNHVLVGTWDTIEVCDTLEAAVVARMTLGYQLPKTDDRGRQSGSIGSMAINSVREEIADGSESGGHSPRPLVAKIAVSRRNVVAVGDENGNIGMWDLNSGNHVASIPSEVDRKVEQLQFSPNGRWLAYYVGGALHVEDVSTVTAPDKGMETPSQKNSDATTADRRVSVISAE
jgi:WD40 repeat protein